MANKRAAPEEHSPPRKVARAECVQLVIRSLVPTAHASPAEDVSRTSEDQSEADAEPDDGQSIAEVTETYAGSEVESVESVESEDSAAGQSEDEDEGSDDDEESEEDEDADIFSRAESQLFAGPAHDKRKAVIYSMQCRLGRDISEVLDGRLQPKEKRDGEWVPLESTSEWPYKKLLALRKLVWCEVTMDEINDRLVKRVERRIAEEDRNGKRPQTGFPPVSAREIHDVFNDLRETGKDSMSPDDGSFDE